MAQNIKIDKYNLYNKSATNFWELADKKCLSNNDIEFANANKFEDKIEYLSYRIEKNLIQSGIKEKNYKLVKEEIFIKNIGNDNNLALSLMFDQIDFPEEKPSLLT